jgi:hypothetical protein
MIGGWCLLRGLHSLLHLNPTGLFDKSKDAAAQTTAKAKQQSETSGISAAAKSRDPSSLVAKFAYGKM